MKVVERILAKARFMMGLGILLNSGTLALQGCGINWSLPADHFNGVNEYGAVSYWEQLGTIKISDDLQIPLVMGFQSDRQWSSPYLGKGWILALLDSNIVQSDDNHFVMVQPDGLTRTFWRANASDTTLGGQGGWKAEISGDTITAWAECGWKLVYTKGKLTSIAPPQGPSLDFVYEDGRVRQINYGAETILQVSSDPSHPGRLELGFDQKKIEIEQGNRPEIQNIGGQNVVGQIDQSLSQISFPDGSASTYKFAVNDRLQPTLAISGQTNRLITWDPATNKILADGNWNYTIVPHENSNAEITRRNKAGQTEYWFYDEPDGRDIDGQADGEQTITTWFTSGILNGKLRKIETVKGDQVISKEQRSYDEQGRLIRVAKDNGTATSNLRTGSLGWNFVYDDVKKTVTMIPISNVIPTKPNNQGVANE